jgi:hypothetical protein
VRILAEADEDYSEALKLERADWDRFEASDETEGYEAWDEAWARLDDAYNYRQQIGARAQRLQRQLGELGNPREFQLRLETAERLAELRARKAAAA